MSYQINWWKEDKQLQREKEARWAKIDAKMLYEQRLRKAIGIGIPLIIALITMILVVML